MKKFSRASQGLSLIELMVALTSGSLLIIGAVSVYVQSRTTFSVNEAVARLQENARYAMSTLEPDIRLANFWGLVNDPMLISGTVGNTPLPVATVCGAVLPLDLRRPIEGSNSSYALACAERPAGAAAAPDADAVIVRHANEQNDVPSAQRLQVYSSFERGASRVFQAAAAPGPMVNDPVFGPRQEVRDLVVRAYYVSQDSQQRPGLPSLRRWNLVAGPDFQDEEIMPGVEDLQIQFGIEPGTDFNSDGIADVFTGQATRYVDPDDPALVSEQVVAVRLWIRVRAENPEVGFTDDNIYNYADVNFTPNDSFRRLLVSRTIQLRNSLSVPL